MKKQPYIIPVLFLLYFSLVATAGWAQTSYFGPFESDSNTVLLMHFDGNLKDAAHLRKANSHGNISFIENNQLPGGSFGQQIRIHNKPEDPDSYLQFPDDPAYDLQGAWTMQLWFNIFTTSNDKRQNPRLIIKPGNPHYHSNYYAYLVTSGGQFRTGHFENNGNNSWIQVAASKNTVQTGWWYYLTYIRDTTTNQIIQIIHRLNSKGWPELESFRATSFSPQLHSPPAANDNPLYIGRGGADNRQRFDGFMDELRISNTVRKNNIPALLENIEPRTSHPVNQSIYFQAEVAMLPSSIQMDSVKLYYRINDKSFNSVAMSKTGEESYHYSMPAQQAGTHITYYIRAWTDYGMDSRAPFNPPDKKRYYQFEVGQTTAMDPLANGLPQSIRLHSNYPNPFNPSTTISYYLPKPMKARLTIYTVTGRRIGTLAQGYQTAGSHKVTFTADNLGSGLYIYELRAGEQRRSGKMTLIK